MWYWHDSAVDPDPYCNPFNYMKQTADYWPKNYIKENMWNLQHYDYDDTPFDIGYKYREWQGDKNREWLALKPFSRFRHGQPHSQYRPFQAPPQHHCLPTLQGCRIQHGLFAWQVSSFWNTAYIGGFFLKNIVAQIHQLHAATNTDKAEDTAAMETIRDGGLTTCRTRTIPSLPDRFVILAIRSRSQCSQRPTTFPWIRTCWQMKSDGCLLTSSTTSLLVTGACNGPTDDEHVVLILTF
mgnify:CR=1 FL=1